MSTDREDTSTPSGDSELDQATLREAAGRYQGLGAPDQVDGLLASGVNPNTPKASAALLAGGIEDGWESCDPAPQFDPWDDEFQPPLYRAVRASPSDPAQREERERIINSLLGHGADVLFVFPQRVDAAPWQPGWDPKRSPFPGQDPREPPSGFDWDSGAEYDWDEAQEEEPPTRYGLRSLLHAVIEDGCWVEPLLNFPGATASLDVEHRDPQGRTLLLSACRSVLGADALMSNSSMEYRWNPDGGGLIRDPIPAWDPEDTSDALQELHPGTLFHYLVQRGADMTAVDSDGRNVLHHLLVEVCGRDAEVWRSPPAVRRTLRYVARRWPALVNQPDSHGMYPLHMALRRLRLNARGREGESRTRSHRVGCVWELIRAGADIRARDGRGNTALHYMADDDPASVWPDLGPERRQLLFALLKDCSADDVNARNNDGRTVAELLLDDDNKFEEAKIQAGKEAPWQAIDEEVFAALDTAGVDWLAPTSEGESLLLPVARCQLAQPRTLWRAQYLVAKGLNPNAADMDGTPVRQVAEACYNPFLVKYFDEALERQALDYCVEWKAGKGKAT